MKILNYFDFILKRDICWNFPKFCWKKFRRKWKNVDVYVKLFWIFDDQKYIRKKKITKATSKFYFQLLYYYIILWITNIFDNIKEILLLYFVDTLLRIMNKCVIIILCFKYIYKIVDNWLLLIWYLELLN